MFIGYLFLAFFVQNLLISVSVYLAAKEGA
jgi:hypothetical protein